MYEVEIQNPEKIVLKPTKSGRRELMFYIGIYVAVLVACIWVNWSIIEIVISEALFMLVTLLPGISRNKTITLDKYGMVISFGNICKQYDWTLVNIWEIKAMDHNTSYKYTSYKKAIVIAPLWMKPPKLINIENVEMFLKPLTFAVIRYKPEKFHFNEVQMYHYDKELLLQKLDEWGAINIEDWRKRYPN